jgi:hypothetical protein
MPLNIIGNKGIMRKMAKPHLQEVLLLGLFFHYILQEFKGLKCYYVEL